MKESSAGPTRSCWRRFAALAALLVAFTGLMVLISAPAPFLLGPLMGSGVFSMIMKPGWVLPRGAFHGGVAVVGAGAGALIDPSTGAQLIEAPLIILGGVFATIVFSLLTGLVLLLSPLINVATAMLGSLAGAASGVSAIAKEVDADEVVVAAIQYARVLIVIGAITLGAAVFGGPDVSADVVNTAKVDGSLLFDLAFMLLSAGGGLLLARVLPFTGASLLYATTLAVIASTLAPFPVGAPQSLLNIGYAVIGLSVGLSFTVGTLATLRRVFPLALIQILLNVAGSAGLGFLLAVMLDVPLLSGFLAMSPGGLPTVAAVAVQAGDDVALIIAMQILRMFLAIVTAVLIAATLGYGARRRFGEGASDEGDV